MALRWTKVDEPHYRQPSDGYGNMVAHNILFFGGYMVPQGRIELPTSSLPMTRSTTELLRLYSCFGIYGRAHLTYPRQWCKMVWIEKRNL